MIRKIALTGTRQTQGISIPVLYDTFGTLLSNFDHKNIKWYVGGAVGMDTELLNWLTVNSVGNITVVVPHTVTRQPIEAVKAIKKAATLFKLEIIELKSPAFPNAEAYYARNRFMVNESNFTIGFPHATQPSNGTYYTLAYAKKTGKPRLIWPVS